MPQKIAYVKKFYLFNQTCNTCMHAPCCNACLCGHRLLWYGVLICVFTRAAANYVIDEQSYKHTHQYTGLINPPWGNIPYFEHIF